ncbi:MAG: hypothetical protein RL670_364 [Actinomycetota bacterium]|jgi:hypothetical protein
MSKIEAAKFNRRNILIWISGLVALVAIVVIVFTTVSGDGAKTKSAADNPAAVSDICRGIQADIAGLTDKSTDAEVIATFVDSAKKRSGALKTQGNFSLYLHLLAQVDVVEAAKKGSGASSQYNNAVGQLNSLCMQALNPKS